MSKINVNILNFMNEHGYDFTKIKDLEKYVFNLSFCDVEDLTNVIMPKGKTIIDFHDGNDIKNVKLPKGDYTNSNFKNVYLDSVEFTDDSKLPKDFFISIYSASIDIKLPVDDYSKFKPSPVIFRSILYPEGSTFFKDKEIFDFRFESGTLKQCLPPLNFNEYNFYGTYIIGFKFHKDTVFPDNREFFQNLYDRSTNNCYIDNLDFSKYDIDNIRLDSTSFGINVNFTEDTESFQRIHEKNLSRCNFAKIDLSKYNTKGLDFRNSVFGEDSEFPKNKNFFKNLKHDGIVKASLPSKDYSFYDFTNVNLENVSFGENSILPKENDFFQKIKNKSLWGVIMPKLDYSCYDFNGVNLCGCKFHSESILPKTREFLEIASENLPVVSYLGESVFPLPKDLVRNIDLINIEGLKISLLGYEEYLSEKQLKFLRVKYRDEIGKNILLPDKGLFKEKSKNNDILIQL